MGLFTRGASPHAIILRSFRAKQQFLGLKGRHTTAWGEAPRIKSKTNTGLKGRNIFVA